MRNVVLVCVGVLSMAARPGSAQTSDELQQLKRLSLEELMQLDVTTVSRRSEPIIDAPAAISVITAEDIRRSGLSTLPDLMRLAGGLTVARFNGGSWGISTRGFTSTANNKLLVLIDGRSIYTQLFGGVFWETQDYFLGDIDRIEVIRGPAGTLWGPNAVNGVINVITKRAADTQGGLLRAEAGSREPGYASVRYGRQAGENRFLSRVREVELLFVAPAAVGRERARGPEQPSSRIPPRLRQRGERHYAAG